MLICRGLMVESQTPNWKVVGSRLGSAGIVVWGVNVQCSLHSQYPDWDALEQGTEPPTDPRAPQHKWLPIAPGVCSWCVCVCVFIAVCVHLDG